MASQALEDYLKIIYKLEDSSPEDKGVQTSVIAERLSISQASVSNMIKKLADKKYISYAPYYGVTLTDSGRKIALNMIRKHRILEQYLVERLNYSWDEVDEEAEVLEHAISDTLANRMWDDLGQPTHDPHGSPIPSIDGELIEQDLIPLIDVLLEQPVQVKRIKNRSPEELRYLYTIGLLDCCQERGCWVSTHTECKRPWKGTPYATCLAMIKPEVVIQQVLNYVKMGRIIRR